MKRLNAIRLTASVGLVMIALAGGIFMAREPILRRIGTQLVRSDSLVRADAIVVLAGDTPLREIHAADLYLAAYAPRVLLTTEPEPAAANLLRARGIAFETRIDLRKRIVRSLGVPDSAVMLLDHVRATSTRGEAELVRAWAVSSGAKRIIVVTSRYHTTRASLIFKRILRGTDVDVLMRAAADDPFTPDHWWQDREQLRNGIFEWQKLLFYYFAYR